MRWPESWYIQGSCELKQYDYSLANLCRLRTHKTHCQKEQADASAKVRDTESCSSLFTRQSHQTLSGRHNEGRILTYCILHVERMIVLL